MRQNRGISLEQISEATKISIRSLKAIECGEFKKLPGGIYNTSYIRQYAHAIDFDESELLAYYHSQMGLAPSTDRAVVRGERKDSDWMGGMRTASLLR